MKYCTLYVALLIGFSGLAQEKSTRTAKSPSSTLQLNAAPRQRLDSIINTETLFYKEQGNEYVVNHIGKTIYLYDSLNSRIGTILCDNGFEKAEEWQGSKILIGRDALGRDSVVYRYSFRNKMFDWQLKSKTVYSYEKNSRKHSSYTSYERNSSWEEEKTDEWDQRDLVEFKYDQYDSLIEKISYSWSYSSNEKRPNNKDVYQYDHKNKVLHSISYIWDRIAKDWQPHFKKEEYFNQKWNVTSGIQSSWDAKDKTWKKNQKSEYVYNTSNKIIEEKYYFWNFPTSVYLMTAKNSYVYDKAGNASTEIRTNWSWTSNEMTSKSKHECLYDNLNNMITSNYYNWNLSKNVWEIGSASNSAYDHAIPGKLIKTPYYSNSKLLSEKGVSYSNGVKKSTSEYRYYYSDL